jgi:hypothetical protein
VHSFERVLALLGGIAIAYDAAIARRRPVLI